MSKKSFFFILLFFCVFHPWLFALNSLQHNQGFISSQSSKLSTTYVEHETIYIDGNNTVNTSNNFYNATGFNPETNYTITVHTKDTTGNVNDTDVNSTASTLPDIQVPTYSNQIYQQRR